MDIPADSTSDARTLTQVIDDFEGRDFRAQFMVRGGGRVECAHCSAELDASELDVETHERLEGASDPAEMMLVAAAACPRCGTKGTLVLSYGPMATAEDAAVEGRLPIE